MRYLFEKLWGEKSKTNLQLFIINCVYLGHFGIPASVDGTAKNEFCILQKETVSSGYILNKNTFGDKLHLIMFEAKMSSFEIKAEFWWI